ncbi:MAG: YbhB/YbcL family Raf kinase inhibitor-like protein [Actinobacteria bacterium]|nr:YbhB/YbcL family Raf kinase inhibitor-like protein [Actinomycetota bacterium]
MPAPNRTLPPIPYDCLAAVPGFTVTSTDVTDGGAIDKRFIADASFGLDGENISPNLTWTGHPDATRSFVVTCFDPDAPTGSGFWHWVLIDIPGHVTELVTGAASGDCSGLPTGAFHVGNDTTSTCWTGPFPPAGHGPHRYVFAVHALSVESLGLDATARPAVVGFTMADVTLARAVLTATYEVPG